LYHLLHEALSDLDNGGLVKTSTQGGTTDVGLHTGCILRNTCFPLVLSVLHVILVDNLCVPLGSESFEKAVAVYLLGFLDRMPHQNEMYDARYCDRVFAVMHEAHQFIHHVENAAFKKTVVDNIMEPRYRALEKLKLNEECHLTYEPFEEILASLRAPSLPTGGRKVDGMSRLGTLIQAREEAKKNLEFTDVKSLVPSGEEQDCFVQLHLHNEHFWSMAMGLDETPSVVNICKERKRLEDFSTHSQFRCIVDAISLNTLPFDSNCVHILLKQSMISSRPFLMEKGHKSRMEGTGRFVQ
jgi:hypothetical protein